MRVEAAHRAACPSGRRAATTRTRAATPPRPRARVRPATGRAVSTSLASLGNLTRNCGRGFRFSPPDGANPTVWREVRGRARRASLEARARLRYEFFMAQNSQSATATRNTIPGTANDAPVAPSLFTAAPRREDIPDAKRTTDAPATPEPA